jgi:glyoxylase-like metal-dependent hydrolase (beta-lactamase superfamily II)
VPALSEEGDANVYLLRHDGRAALIDCASLAGRAAIEANVRETGVEPSELDDLLLTHSHWDHTQAARDWQSDHGLRTHLNALGAEFLARGDHRLVGAQLQGPDYPFTPFAVDHPVADGESFDLAGVSVTARFLPGHTLDSTLYSFEHEGVRVGVCGDVAFGCKGGGQPAIGFLCALWLSNLDDYVKSLRSLAVTHFDLLLPGHGVVVAGREQARQTVERALAVAESLAGDPAVRENFGV